MAIGSSADDIGLIILLILPAVLAPMLLIGIGVVLARIMRLPGVFAVFLAIGAVAALLLGGALALENTGRDIPAIVDRRTEYVDITTQGTWRHERSVALRYRLDSGAPSAAQPEPGESAATLNPPAAQFDLLTEGAPTELRVLPLYRSLALVRLTGTSLIDAVPWIWVGAALGAPLLFLGIRLLAASSIGVAAMVVAALAAGGGIPAAYGYLAWQTGEDFGARPLRAPAEVSEVTRITQVDPFPCRPGGRSRCERRNTTYDVAQPYDIVQLRFVPEGAHSPVIAVDAVDAAGVQFAPGDRVELAYAPDDTRAALIVGATHTHYWRNAIMPAAICALIAGLIAAFIIYAGRRFTQARRMAHQRRPIPGGV